MYNELLARFRLRIYEGQDGYLIRYDRHPIRSGLVVLFLVFLLMAPSVYMVGTRLFTGSPEFRLTLLLLLLLCTCLLCLYKIISILTDYCLVSPGTIVCRRWLIRRRIDMSMWKLEIRTGAGRIFGASYGPHAYNSLTFYLVRGDRRRRVLTGRTWSEQLGEVQAGKRQLVKLLRGVLHQ